MTVLAIETATAVTAVALVGGDHDAEVVVDRARRHTEVLASAIERLLGAWGHGPHELDGIVVDVGPGLFTGLRVGVATAKGLSIATGVGLHTVTSTDALAEAAWEYEVAGTVVAVVDARRREVFTASYRCSPDGVEQLGGVLVESPSELAARLDAIGDDVTLVGDGAVRHRDVLDGGSRTIRSDLDVPSPGAAGRLVLARVEQGEVALGHADVHPWYVREADAVANFAVRDSDS